MLIGVPVSFGIALFLTELSPAWLKRPLGTAIELLAAIPSIIYGMWGLFVFAPLFQSHAAAVADPVLRRHPVHRALFAGPPLGIGMLTAGLILSIMVIPFIAAVMRDVFEIVPPMLKESAYGLGATTWEVVWRVVLPYTKVGVVGGIMLGLGRALGETMAVTFVIGNAHRLAASLMAPGNSIASALANEFTEAVGDVYFSALIELGLILFLITTVVLAFSKLLLMQLAESEGYQHMSAVLRSGWRCGAGSFVESAVPLAQARQLRPARRSRASRSRSACSGWSGFSARCCTKAATALARATLYYQMTPPPGGDGGLANAIAGSLVMVGAGTLLGTPVGILAGTYLAGVRPRRLACGRDAAS